MGTLTIIYNDINWKSFTNLLIFFFLQLLHDQVGVVEFEAYKALFMQTFSRSRSSYQALTLLPPLFGCPHRNWWAVGSSRGSGDRCSFFKGPFLRCYLSVDERSNVCEIKSLVTFTIKVVYNNSIFIMGIVYLSWECVNWCFENIFF